MGLYRRFLCISATCIPSHTLLGMPLCPLHTSVRLSKLSGLTTPHLAFLASNITVAPPPSKLPRRHSMHLLDSQHLQPHPLAFSCFRSVFCLLAMAISGLDFVAQVVSAPQLLVPTYYGYLHDYFCLASTYMLGAVHVLGPEVLNALVLSFECDYAACIPCPLSSGIPCTLGTSPVAFPFR